MLTLSFNAARSRLANLSRTRPHDDPEVAALRHLMREQFVVHKVAQIVENGPALTVGMRDQIIDIVDRRLAQASAA